MKNREINLRTWMYLKAVPAALFLVYYWMCTRDHFHPAYVPAQTAVFAIAGALAAFQITYAKKREIFDEFARENLKTTDSFCLKVAYVLMICAAIVCVFTDFSGEAAGYCILLGILLLTLLRAALFSWNDRKGM